MKVCSTCKVEKDISAFGKHAGKRDGLRSQCKACVNETNAAYKAANKARVDEANARYRSENRDKVNLANRAYRQRHHEAILEREAQWREENRDEIRLYQARWQEENRDRLAEWNRRYREENRDRIRENHRRYRSTEHGRASTINRGHQRRASIRVTDITAEWMSALLTQGYCSLCDVELKTQSVTPTHADYPNVDHIIPLSLGGLHMRSNVRLLCRGCNLQRPKDARDIDILNECAIQVALEAV